ncbi:MAG: flagellar basal body rod protein FlgC [Sphingomonas sp.]
MDAIAISRTGLDVEWQRLQVIASNLANVNTARTATGEAFRPMHLLSGPQMDFSKLVRGGEIPQVPGGVKVLGIAARDGGVRRVHEPDHPDADADGFVTYPDIDHSAEMTLLIRTSRAYEANLTVFSIAQQMYTRAAELGRNS